LGNAEMLFINSLTKGNITKREILDKSPSPIELRISNVF
jgi:hypothetical protein